MKKRYSFVLSLFALIACNVANATTHIITQEGFTFAPNIIAVEVGDTMLWQWTAGTHTTTSLVIPDGADAWDEPLTAGSPTFEYKVEVAGAYAYKCTPHFEMGMAGGFAATGTTATEPVAYVSADFTSVVDNNHQLHLNISNAQNDFTTIHMMDLSGKLVATLVNEKLAAGQHQLQFNLSAQTMGIYFLRMEQSGKVVTRKILIN